MIKKVIGAFVLVSILGCNFDLSKKEKEEFLGKGKEITRVAFEELSSNLMKQMSEGGPSKALPFCNIEAIPLTKSIEEKFHVSIKRASDRYRNPNNKASQREMEIIEQYKKDHLNLSDMKPIVERNEANMVTYYEPILVNSKCMVCHGKVGEALNIKTDSLIKTLYPEDLATGYREGDVRGVWRIEFKEAK